MATRRKEEHTNPLVNVTLTPCANFPGCHFAASKPDDFSEDERRGRMLCVHCYKIDSERMQRWINAGRPTQAESMSKIRAILKRTPRWKAIGKWAPIGQINERQPGEALRAPREREAGED